MIAFVIPGTLTIWNIYNLCADKPKKEKLISCLTIFVGGILYLLLYSMEFEEAGDWYEQVNTMQIHYSIASQYMGYVVLLVLLGFAGLLTLLFMDANRLPPLISVLSVAAIILLNILQIVFAIQIRKNVDWIDLLLYVYHVNILILSVAAVRKQIRQQIIIIQNKDMEVEQHKKFKWLYYKMNSISQYTALVLICLFFLIAILEIIFVITGEGLDAPIKAFTDTADWTFSKQTPPPPSEYDGHYLCTIAAGGHKKVVKPLRLGTRRGETIVVNRQLCVANAFEEYIHDKFPVFHRHIRSFYDNYGYPVSKHINSPIKADIVYFLMKPLEWVFLLFLYTVDLHPEQRISRQYKYCGKEKREKNL